jgi:hypothetical protein
MALDVRDRLNELPRSQKLYKATLVKQFADVLKQYQSIQDESLRKEKIIVSSLEEEMASAKDEKKAMGKAEGDQFEFSLEEMVRCATRAAIAPTTYIWHREWRT